MNSQFGATADAAWGICFSWHDETADPPRRKLNVLAVYGISLRREG